MTQSKTSSPSANPEPGFIKVATGTVISGGMAYLFIRLLMSILRNLPPIAVDGSPLARSISIGVRYMLVGSIGLMAFMFSVVTIGLFAYILQLAWQGLAGRRSSNVADVQPAAHNISKIVAEERKEGDRRSASTNAATSEETTREVGD